LSHHPKDKKGLMESSALSLKHLTSAFNYHKSDTVNSLLRCERIESRGKKTFPLNS
jgi:hypothetical protein